MNNLQLIAWAQRTGRLVIHNPSVRCPYYSVVMQDCAVHDRSLPLALDMACERLRHEALTIEPHMA